MRLPILCALALLSGCAHQEAAPRVQVTVMRMGPIYPALAVGCPVTFLNGQHIEILGAGYEQLGLISFSGEATEMDRASAQVPDAVNAAACRMGGNAVSLNTAAAVPSFGVVQFSVWRSRTPATPPPPSPPPAPSTST